MSLTDTHIKNLKPTGKPKKYFDGGGLFLFISATGNKLWRMAYAPPNGASSTLRAGNGASLPNA